MRILVVLWTVCLIRLCSAGCCGKSKTKDDDDGPYGGSKENLRNTHKPSGQSVASPQVKRGVEQSTNEASPEVTQDATTRQSTPTSEESRVPQPTGQAGGTTPITLDLAKPDETNVRVGNQSRDDGVSFKTVTPRDAFHISSVMDAGATVWKSSGDEKCILVESYAKGGVELLYLETSGGTMSKYFEKNGSNWKEIKQDEFNGKLATLMGETLDLSNPDTSKFDVHTETKSEVTVKYHYPKDTSLDTSKITTVVDGEKEVSPEASQDLSTNKPDIEDSPVVQQNLYTPTQSPPSGQTANSDQKTTESAKRGQGVKVKPVESPVPTPKEEVSPQDNGTRQQITYPVRTGLLYVRY